MLLRARRASHARPRAQQHYPEYTPSTYGGGGGGTRGGGYYYGAGGGGVAPAPGGYGGYPHPHYAGPGGFAVPWAPPAAPAPYGGHAGYGHGGGVPHYGVAHGQLSPEAMSELLREAAARARVHGDRLGPGGLLSSMPGPGGAGGGGGGGGGGGFFPPPTMIEEAVRATTLDPANKFKTKLCIFWLNSGGAECPYKDRCLYAHGAGRARAVRAGARGR